MSPPDPVFLLSPPCTFSWVVAAVLGQHAQTYAVPELHLFRTETVREWLELCGRESFEMDHGLVRAVAELCYGEQTEQAAAEARGWLRRRAHLTTGLLLEQLAEFVAPRVLIERSPSHIYSGAFMGRILQMFPNARFIHLTGHPRAFGETVMHALAQRGRRAAQPATDWVAQLASFPGEVPGAGPAGEPDPQRAWLALHRNIGEFLATVPKEQRRLMKGEDILAADEHCLTSFLRWLGLPSGPAVVDAMNHPELSPYARPGPSSARAGSDAFMFGGCDYPPDWRRTKSLGGPLGWRSDGGGFLPAVSQLAEEFGYR